MALIQDGRTDYQIVSPGRSFPVENEAARVLSDGLFTMTGVRIPVRWGDRKTPDIPTIWVGEREAGPPELLETDEYWIRTDGRDLHLAGRFRRGTHYAVHGFLESLGVRYHAPGCVHYPRTDRIDMPENSRSSRAAFSYRHVFYPDTWIPEWALRLKLNVHSGSDPRWGPNAKAHSWGHSFDALVPPRRYYDDHPDYFCLVDGRRRKEDAQLCCTNPELTETVSANLAKRIDAHPGMNIFAVGQNDRNNWCECPQCTAVDEREGTHMGQVLTLVNRVAKRFPDRMIATLAYAWSVEPPKTMRAADNVLIVLCHNEGCFSHGLDRCELNAPFLDRLGRWKKMAANVMIWDYYVNYRHYLLPTANFRRIQNDLRLYRDMGIRSMFCQGSASTGGQFEHLRQYVTAKLLWDPELDAARLMTEWAETVYGVKASQPILEYLNLLEERHEKGHVHCPSFSQNRVDDLFTPEVLKRGVELWDRAEQAADTPERKQRVFAARSAEMASRLVHARGEYRVEGDSLKLHPPVDRALTDRFVDACVAANVSYLREDRGAPEDFRNDFGRTYRAVTLENELLKAVILPELGARIYSLRIMPDGVEMLAVPRLFESINCAPYSDGYDFSLERRRLGFGAVEEYRIVFENDHSASLEAEIAGGFDILTKFVLADNTLEVSHTVTNRSDAPAQIEPVMNPAWNGAIFDDASTLEITTASGTVESVPVNPEQRKVRDVLREGGKCPAGSWTLVSGDSRFAVRAEFPEEEVSHTRMLLGGNMIALQHCFTARLVAPGCSTQATSSWKFERSAPA